MSFKKGDRVILKMDGGRGIHRFILTSDPNKKGLAFATPCPLPESYKNDSYINLSYYAIDTEYYREFNLKQLGV